MQCWIGGNAGHVALILCDLADRDLWWMMLAMFWTRCNDAMVEALCVIVESCDHWVRSTSAQQFARRSCTDNADDPHEQLSDGLFCFCHYLTSVQSQNHSTLTSDRQHLSCGDCPGELSRVSRVFTALHGMQTRSSDENSVCPSVCPSVCLSHACIVTKR